MALMLPSGLSESQPERGLALEDWAVEESGLIYQKDPGTINSQEVKVAVFDKIQIDGIEPDN
jgi:hypothetical protein